MSDVCEKSRGARKRLNERSGHATGRDAVTKWLFYNVTKDANYQLGSSGSESLVASSSADALDKGGGRGAGSGDGEALLKDSVKLAAAQYTSEGSCRYLAYSSYSVCCSSYTFFLDELR